MAAVLGALAKPAAADYETVVQAERNVEAAGATVLDREAARRLPGTGDDALRAVENAAGVARAALGSGQLVVWGAGPQDSRVLVDGVEVPSLYHLGGLRTILPSAFVKEVALLPGGYGAEYGRALGGLLQVQPAAPRGQRFSGSLAVDALDAAGTLSFALGSAVKVFAAGRYGYIDRLLQALGGEKLGSVFPLPSYGDFQLRTVVSLRPGEALTATLLFADDTLRRSHQTAGVALDSEAWARSFFRLGLRYERRLGDGSAVAFAPWFGYDVDAYTADFGNVLSRLATSSYRYGLRSSYRARLGRRLALLLGLDWQGAVTALTRFGTLTRPPREGDIAVFGQPPGSEINADDWTTHLADFSPFLSAVVRLGPVSLEPGLRLGGHLLETSRLTPRIGATPAIGGRQLAWTAEPRLSLRYRPLRRLSLYLSGGLFHQPPQPADLSAVFGNPRLGLSRAAHAVVGAHVELVPGLVAEVTGFYRYLDNLAARSPLATPPLAGALTGDGRGHSYGGQLLVRLSAWRGLSGWVAYTLSRSVRKDADSRPLRPFDLDQTHILAAVAGYRRGGFGFGLRLRYSSGFPRTQVIDAYYDSRSDRYQPVFGIHNDIRLPDFVQLDARVDRDFRFRRLALSLYLEVQNVTYQRNAEELVYRFDFSQADYITGLPTLAVLGSRLAW